MFVAKKKDLSFVDGYVLDKDNTVVNNYTLVEQFNELVEISEFNQFLKKNETKIKNVGTTVTYTIEHAVAAIQIAHPKTPLKDAKVKAATELFNEMESHDSINQANDILNRYAELAAFVKDENVLITGEATTRKFHGNPLEIDEKWISDIVLDYVKYEDLRNKVIVKSN